MRWSGQNSPNSFWFRQIHFSHCQFKFHLAKLSFHFAKLSFHFTKLSFHFAKLRFHFPKLSFTCAKQTWKMYNLLAGWISGLNRSFSKISPDKRYHPISPVDNTIRLRETRVSSADRWSLKIHRASHLLAAHWPFEDAPPPNRPMRESRSYSPRVSVDSS